jgi:3',5'-cyclic AMP phosphodiesterase CpdA
MTRGQRLGLSIAVCLPLACGDDAESGDDGTTGGGGSSSGTTLEPSSSSSGIADDTGSGSSSGSSGDVDLPDPLPPLGEVVLTTDARRVQSHAISPEPINDPREVDQLDQMIADGFGDQSDAPGEPILDVTLDGSNPPTSGPGAARVTRFVHLADTQLPDDESPTRLVSFDNAEQFSGAFRPQDGHACAMVNAAVRTINAVHADDPLDFVVLGGDNADSAQTNEVQWYLGILDGAPVVECDSGLDDDPVAGPGNDNKDPFAPVGLDVPWYWVMGNHDVLVQGNFAIETRKAAAIGDDAAGGTRDWSMPGGPMIMGTVAADEGRALLDGPTLLGLVSSSGDGHGVDEDVVTSGKAQYTFDVGDTDIRFIILDTAAQTGGSEGVIRQAQVDAFIRPALDAAVDDGMRVLLASHHASGSLTDGGGLGGAQQADALTTEEWQGLLGEYDNVIAHLCGHSHVHRVTAIEPIGGHAYWEILTSAIADHPHQMRIFEIRDEDNGFLSLQSIALDVALPDDDPLAQQAWQRGITDNTSGWEHTGEGLPEDRNVRIWVPNP